MVCGASIFSLRIDPSAKSLGVLVMDVYTRRLVGFGVERGNIEGSAVCRMFNRAIAGQACRNMSAPIMIRCFGFIDGANLRVLAIEEVKSVPYAPLSHPFVERLIGTVRREYLDHLFFWNATTNCSAPFLRIRTFVLMVRPLVTFPLASQMKVPTFRTTASQQDQATLMPDAAQPVYRHRLSLSRSRYSLRFRHHLEHFDTSSVVPLQSSSCQSSDLVMPGLFLRCSPPWLLTTAAGGDLKPAPVSRLRGTYPHRSCSYTLGGPFRTAFALVAHSIACSFPPRRIAANPAPKVLPRNSSRPSSR